MKKKLTCLLLSAMMLLSLLPLAAMADPDVPDNNLEAQQREERMKVSPGNSATMQVYVYPEDREDITCRWYHAHITDAGLSYGMEGFYSYTEEDLIPGAEDNAYTVENVQQREIYVCVVSDPYGNRQKCPFEVAVDNLLTVDAVGSPRKSVAPGEAATLRLTVQADDMTDITYQWYKNDDPISGAEGDSYTTPPFETYTDYTCRVTDRYGNTEECWFCVFVPNHLSVQPGDGKDTLSVKTGESATLRLTVSADDMTGLTYRWYDENWEAIPGAEGDTLQIDALEETASFVCQVTDRYGNTEDCWIEVKVKGPEDFGGKCGALLNWTLSDDGVLTVTGLGPMADFSDESTIPWYKSREEITALSVGQGVTSIGEGAFNRCTSLTEITLPDTLLTIGSNAFNECTALPSVTLPGNVKNISAWAFGNCDALTSIEMKEGNGNYCSVDGMLLSADGATLLTVPNGMAQVTIPDTVTTIAEAAFVGCRLLTEVTIPAGVTTIEMGSFLPFDGCTSLRTLRVAEGNGAYSAQNGLLLSADGTTLLECLCGLATVTIPDTVTDIGEESFSRCHLAQVTIPAAVRQIGEQAFAFSDTLKRVTFLGAAPDMAQTAFFGTDATLCYPKAEEASWEDVIAAVYDKTWEPWESKQLTVVSALPTGSAPVTAVVRNDQNEVVPAAVEGKTLSLAEMPEGTYTMELAQEGCVSRTVTVTVDAATAYIPSVVLVQVGNLNGTANDFGEETDVSDMQCLFEYLAQNEMSGALAGDQTYFLAVANVNGDDAVNILDYQALYAMLYS